jgi:hypothetical protein
MIVWETQDQRILSVATAMNEGWTVEKIHKLSCIDRWFLNRLMEITEHNKLLSTQHPHSTTKEVSILCPKVSCHKEISPITLAHSSQSAVL